MNFQGKKGEGTTFHKDAIGSLALVNSSSGAIGTGLIVDHPSGGTGVLTALHVVVRAILRDKLSVSLTRIEKLEFEPISIRIAARSDAALIKVKSSIKTQFPVSKWGDTPISVSIGDSLHSYGLPGKYKKKHRGIWAWLKPAPAIEIPCAVTSLNDEGLIVGTIDRKIEVPDSLAGISGGPVFDSGGDLIGINTIEGVFGNRVTELHITARERWADLLNPFRVGDDGPKDYELSRQQVHLHLGLMNPGTKVFDGPTFHAVVNGGIWRSPSEPNHQWGCVGRIDSILIDGSRYPINVESLYTVADRNDRSTWYWGFAAEVDTLFRLMSLKKVDI